MPFLPNLCTRCLSTKNENIRNCSPSIQGYCFGSWSTYLPVIYQSEQGSVHKICIFISDREVHKA